MTLTGLLPQPPYPWLGELWQRFARLVDTNRLPHALVIVGPEGVGCDSLARAMAQYLLCAAPHNGRSCGTCKACKLLQVESHPDVYLVHPEEKSSVIKIDQIREMNQFTSNTAQQGGRKVVLIHPAEAMNPNAANALLKNLEEPIGNCLFLLVAQQPALLMATIRSRCTRMEVALPPKEQALEWLARNQIADAEIKLHAAGGRPLRVVAWLEQDLWGQRTALHGSLMALMEGKTTLAACAKALTSYNIQWVLDQLLQWLQESARGRHMTAPGEVQDALVARLRHGAQPRLFGYYEQLLMHKRRLASGANPNPALLLDELLMGLRELAP